MKKVKWKTNYIYRLLMKSNENDDYIMRWIKKKNQSNNMNYYIWNNEKNKKLEQW